MTAIARKPEIRQWSAASLTRAGLSSLVASMLMISAASTLDAFAGIQVDLSDYRDAVRLRGVESRDFTGTRMVACDVNGDGIQDLAMGAWEASGPANARTWCGEVYVVYGRKGAWAGTFHLANDRDIWIIGQDPYDGVGESLACGDVNGDGFDDLLLGAPDGNGRANTRTQSGQVHVLFGGPVTRHRMVIDLRRHPGLVIYGAEPRYASGARPVIGDVNGDGIDDILVDASSAWNPTWWQHVGRFDIVFGRTNWPTELDLRTDSDVTVFGRSESDAMGSNLTIGELNGDGIGDVLAVARLADGPDDARTNAGEIHAFLGRTRWPRRIDLARQAADMMFYGPDPHDQAGSKRGLAMADVTGDERPEMLVGLPGAGGPQNDGRFRGELRVFLPSQPLAREVDMGAVRGTVVYGARDLDSLCAWLAEGDINGDGRDDVVCAAHLADGPGEMRMDAGAAVVIFGREQLFDTLDLATDAPDILVHGAREGDEFAPITTTDLNGDGIDEIAGVSGHSFFDDQIPTVWLISPVDTDGDGLSNLSDNCPLVHNPDQADSVGDRLGDACRNDYDGDGRVDPQ